MACAMACVVVDYGGPGTLIRPGNGLKVPLGDKESLVARFRKEMEILAHDSSLRQRLGHQAHRDALELYSWDAKAKKTLEVYDWVLGRGPKPDFYSPSRPPPAAEPLTH
jgi:glycosyltransferase involved in cell wall biosynthesis